MADTVLESAWGDCFHLCWGLCLEFFLSHLLGIVPKLIELLLHLLFMGFDSLSPNKGVSLSIGLYFSAIDKEIFVQGDEAVLSEQQANFSKDVAQHMFESITSEALDGVVIWLSHS